MAMLFHDSFPIADCRLPIADCFGSLPNLILSDHEYPIGNWQSAITSAKPARYVVFRKFLSRIGKHLFS
jgi:hypothetical protein